MRVLYALNVCLFFFSSWHVFADEVLAKFQQPCTRVQLIYAEQKYVLSLICFFFVFTSF